MFMSHMKPNSISMSGAQPFLRNQQAGDYNEPSEFCLAITNAIPGNDHFAVEYASGKLS